MVRFFSTLVIALILSFAFNADADADAGAVARANTQRDATKDVICSIIGYVQGLGVPIVTVLIIGAAFLAIFGKMLCPALVELGVFVAAFFGAPEIMSAMSPGAT